MAATTKQFTVACTAEFREIIMAEFAMLGFDSFQESDTGFIAHSEGDIDAAELEQLMTKYADTADASLIQESVEQVNWNEKWEESYDPIIIAEKVLVRASFHKPQPNYPYEIIINPKMSFGTGHHETTGLMMEQQLSIDHLNKKVLDAGCGTGILAILSGKLGADLLYAYDNDPWVKDNIQENFKINKTKAHLLIGTIDTLDLPDEFDIILANINKNILLHDIPFYAERIKSGGHLVLSGFYEDDLNDIRAKAELAGMKFVSSLVKNRWMAARFMK